MLTGISGSKTVFNASTTCSSIASRSISPIELTSRGLRALGARGAGLIQGGLQGVPGERRALDAHRVGAHAGEDGELVDLGVGADAGGAGRLALGHQMVEDVEEGARLRDR